MFSYEKFNEHDKLKLAVYIYIYIYIYNICWKDGGMLYSKIIMI
jgi:hypothetical protein